MNKFKTYFRVLLFLFFIFPQGAFAADWTQTTYAQLKTPTFGGDSGQWSMGSLPQLETVSISINHHLNLISQEGSRVVFSYDIDPPYIYNPVNSSGQMGKWCQNIDEQCFNPYIEPGAIIHIAIPPYSANYASFYKHNLYTGIKPKIKLVSADESILDCPDVFSLNYSIECQIKKSGNSSVSLLVEPISIRGWYWFFENGQLFMNKTKHFYGGIPAGTPMFRLNIFQYFPETYINTNLEPEDALFSLGFQYFFLDVPLHLKITEFQNNRRGYIVKYTALNEYLSSYQEALNNMIWPLLPRSSDQSPPFSEVNWDMIASLSNSYGAQGWRSFYSWRNQKVGGGPISILSPRLPVSELKAMDLVSPSGESFRQAVINRYSAPPFNGFVPVVEYFTPENRTDTLFMPGYPFSPDNPIIITVTTEDPPATNDAPTISVDGILSVVKEQRPEIIVRAKDNNVDDSVRYCVDWNMDGDVTDSNVSSNELYEAEGCFPSVGYKEQEGGEALFNAYQAWKTVGTKTFQVYSEDEHGARSSWVEASVVVTEPSGSSGQFCDGNNIKEGGEECDGSDLGGNYQCQAGQVGNYYCNSSCQLLNNCQAPPSCIPVAEICGNGIDEDCSGSDLTCSAASICNKNKQCERSKGENFFNCSDCRGILKEF